MTSGTHFYEEPLLFPSFSNFYFTNFFQNNNKANMTKIKFLILGFYFFFILYQPFDLWSQNSMQILYGSYIKCKSVQNGYFEMNRHLKFMMSKDTVKSSYKCYFKKLMSDSIYSFIFHSNISFNGIYMGEALYQAKISFLRL